MPCKQKENSSIRHKVCQTMIENRKDSDELREDLKQGRGSKLNTSLKGTCPVRVASLYNMESPNRRSFGEFKYLLTVM